MQFIFMWLGERTEISLHPYQLACIMLIVKVKSINKKIPMSMFAFRFQKTHGSFELHGVQEKELNSQVYNSIMQRLHVREWSAMFFVVVLVACQCWYRRMLFFQCSWCLCHNEWNSNFHFNFPNFSLKKQRMPWNRMFRSFVTIEYFLKLTGSRISGNYFSTIYFSGPSAFGSFRWNFFFVLLFEIFFSF